MVTEFVRYTAGTIIQYMEKSGYMSLGGGIIRGLINADLERESAREREQASERASERERER